MRVEIHTDGSCDGSGSVDSPGGWAAVLRTRMVGPEGMLFYPHERVIKGAKWATTSMEMELTAILEGLSLLNEHANNYQVHIYTDCQGAIDICTKRYRAWIQKEWQSRGKEIPHREIIERIVAICRRHDPIWHWVKSHADNELNNHVDEIAHQMRVSLVDETRSLAPLAEKTITLSQSEVEMVASALQAHGDALLFKARELKGKQGSRKKVKEITQTRELMRKVIQKLR